MENIEGFNIIGISVRTTNEGGKAAKDLGNLWSRFFAENIPAKITNIMSNEMYAIYTDYENDYMGEYTTLVGFKVSSLDDVPEGLTGRAFEGGSFKKFVAKGEMPDSVVNEWQKIWSADKELNRAYTYDYEVYGDKSQKGKDSEIDIYIAVG